MYFYLVCGIYVYISHMCKQPSPHASLVRDACRRRAKRNRIYLLFFCAFFLVRFFSTTLSGFVNLINKSKASEFFSVKCFTFHSCIMGFIRIKAKFVTRYFKFITKFGYLIISIFYFA